MSFEAGLLSAGFLLAAAYTMDVLQSLRSPKVPPLDLVPSYSCESKRESNADNFHEDTQITQIFQDSTGS